MNASVIAAPSETPSADDVELARVYLRAESIAIERLTEAVALRVKHVELHRFEGAIQLTDDARLSALVEVRPAPQRTDELVLTIIVSDGRAFDRRIVVGPDEDASRVAANAIANLLLAIEAGTVSADRGDVALPVVPPCPPCDPKPTPAPAPARAPDAPAVVVPPVAPRLEVGVRVDALATLGLGAPRDADRFSGAGAGLGVAARLRSGAMFGLSVRMIGRRVADAGLLRARFGLGAGYVLRRRALELEASGWLGAEPWWVRRNGAVARFDTSAGGSDDVRPLWHAALRLAPGLRWRGDRIALRTGAFVELGVASMLGDGARVPRIRVLGAAEPPPAARLGGVETSFGFELTTWFAVR